MSKQQKESGCRIFQSLLALIKFHLYHGCFKVAEWQVGEYVQCMFAQTFDK